MCVITYVSFLVVARAYLHGGADRGAACECRLHGSIPHGFEVGGDADGHRRPLQVRQGGEEARSTYTMKQRQMEEILWEVDVFFTPVPFDDEEEMLCTSASSPCIPQHGGLCLRQQGDRHFYNDDEAMNALAMSGN